MTDLKPIDSPATLPGWHMPWPTFDIDWKKSALVVIDMQNYGCNPDAGVAQMLSLRYPDIAGYYVPRLTDTVIPNAKRLLAAFRRAGRQVQGNARQPNARREGGRPDLFQQRDGGQVQGAAQGLPRRDVAREAAVEVLGRVGAEASG